MTALPDSSFSPRLALAALVLWCQAGLLCGAVAAEPVVPVAAMSASSAASAVQSHRPRIGLVLSGGGARGLSHVGVLKVLERERIAVDVIAGTSMGAIVGGLYASGMDAKQVDEEVRRLDWDHVFDSRVERREIPQRRKEQDFEVSPLLEVGVGRQGILAPLGSVSSRGLEAHLRRLTLQSAQVPDFNALPTPFRAVATDMETGQPVVLDRGDLATALRSSMSVPGVFAPVEVDGRILGDGGLVNNTPVDVARAMGAERLIVVNIGTPLSKREVLSTLTGVTGQMINILTEQNVQISLATLKPTDVLIAPVLDGLTAGDFNRASEFINLGETQAEALVLRMQDLKLSEADYAAWKARRKQHSTEALPLQAVRFEGSKLTQPELLRNQIETQPGQPFDVTKAERDLRRLAAAGDYLVTDYQLRRSPQGDELVFKLQDKPWGPDYLQVGLDFSADTNGRSAFNLKLVHNRHWLDSSGAEWRNFVRLGTSPSVATEWYRPLPLMLPDGLRTFVAVGGSLERRQQQLYDDPTGDVDLQLARRTRTVGVDLGLTWRELGEFRLGRIDEATHVQPELISPTWAGGRLAQQSVERGWRLHGVFDQLDSAFFPTQGWRVDGQYVLGERTGKGLSPQAKGDMSRWDLQGQVVTSLGNHSLHLGGRVAGSAGALGDFPRYGLGGFQQLSGYAADQVSGQQVALVRLGYAWRLGTYPVLRSVYLGGSVEGGKAWQQWSRPEDARWRTGNSLYIGADTALGPVYAAIGNAQGVRPTFMLFVGRP